MKNYFKGSSMEKVWKTLPEAQVSDLSAVIQILRISQTPRTQK